jgi:hypothetical protein
VAFTKVLTSNISYLNLPSVTILTLKMHRLMMEGYKKIM